METFEKEITYFVAEYNPATEKVEEKLVTKSATFKELSRLDKTQAKLHFKIMSLFEGLEKGSDEADNIGISSDGLYDITVKAVNVLLLPNDVFTDSDKKDFLQDSIALLQFGLFLFKEKFAPFFSQFNLG